MFQLGIQAAKNQKGVAVVGLPGDVAAADAPEIYGAQQNFYPQTVFRPTDDHIEQLAGLLNGDKKITLYCGHGAKEAVAEVEALAEKLKAPIAYSFRAKIFFDKEESTFTAGMNGLLGNRAGFLACKDADILLLLGTDFPYVEFLPQKNTIIQIDEKPKRIGRRAKVDFGYAGDIRSTLIALLPKIQPRENEEFVKELHEQYLKDQEGMHPDEINAETGEDQVNPEAAALLINRYAAEDAIFTVDTGMTCVWAARLLKTKKGRYLTGSMNHGSMANALPMAIGAAASQPQRQVVALCGDGGISMLLGDLATIMQYKLPVKIIVFNNRSLGMVKLEMDVAGYPDWQTNMVNPPFEKIADLMNIRGIAIHNGRDLDQGIKEAFEHDGPVLVNIFTDQNTLAMPPKVTFDQMKGYATTITKKVLLGDAGEALDLIKAGFKAL